MKKAIPKIIELNGRKVNFRLIRSKTARKLRVRIGTTGVEVVQPVGREPKDLQDFLEAHQDWITQEIERVERIGSVRRISAKPEQEILFRGVKTAVGVDNVARRQGTNKVIFENNTLRIIRGVNSRTAPAKTLEFWLRNQARIEIHRHLDAVTKNLKRHPNRVYIMGQRTKWGNCSSLKNLSFNWRLIMAPDFVMRYIVAHEAVHLAVPDHSQKFWLTVQSLCPEMEQARHWLRENQDKMMTKIKHIIE